MTANHNIEFFYKGKAQTRLINHAILWQATNTFPSLPTHLPQKKKPLARRRHIVERVLLIVNNCRSTLNRALIKWDYLLKRFIKTCFLSLTF